MKVILQFSAFGLGYELVPLSRGKARKLREITGEESVLVDSDWDFTSLAKTLGWRPRKRILSLAESHPCNQGIGLQIEAARHFLDKRVDQVFTNKLDCYFPDELSW